MQEKAQETEKYMSELTVEMEQVRVEKGKLEERNQLLEKVLSLNKPEQAAPTTGLLELVGALTIAAVGTVHICLYVMLTIAHNRLNWQQRPSRTGKRLLTAAVCTVNISLLGCSHAADHRQTCITSSNVMYLQGLSGPQHQCVRSAA